MFFLQPPDSGFPSSALPTSIGRVVVIGHGEIDMPGNRLWPPCWCEATMATDRWPQPHPRQFDTPSRVTEKRGRHWAVSKM